MKTLFQRESLFNKFKVYLFKYLFTENEKCILNQALNLHRDELRKEYSSFILSDYRQELYDLDRLSIMCENKLWN